MQSAEKGMDGGVHKHQGQKGMGARGWGAKEEKEGGRKVESGTEGLGQAMARPTPKKKEPRPLYRSNLKATRQRAHTHRGSFS